MYQKEISDYIERHQKEMIADIFILCRINSEKMPEKPGMPYGEGNVKVLEAALKMAEKYGFQTTNYDNYVGAADLNDNVRQLDILAHLDVVPAGEGWEITQPFEPIEKDGMLYGRGTADDKGPAVAALYAMRAVKELGIPLKKNVRLILGTDEECGSSDIKYYYAKEEEAPMTFTPDASFPVINVEKGRLTGHFTAEYQEQPTRSRVVEVRAGIKFNVVPGTASAVIEGIDEAVLTEVSERVAAQTKVRFTWENQDSRQYITAIGTGAHAACPTMGNNALTALVALLSELPFEASRQRELLSGLAEMLPHGDVFGNALGVAMEDQISGPLTLAFSIFSMKEGKCEGMFDSRCPVCANEENVLKVVRQRMGQAGFALHNDCMQQPHHVDGESYFIKTLLNAYERYTGQKGSCRYTGGGTYVHDLKNGVAFGAAMPETENRMHGADEFAVLDELLVSAKIFAQVIVDLCS